MRLLCQQGFIFTLPARVIAFALLRHGQQVALPLRFLLQLAQLLALFLDGQRVELRQLRLLLQLARVHAVGLDGAQQLFLLRDGVLARAAAPPRRDFLRDLRRLHLGRFILVRLGAQQFALTRQLHLVFPLLHPLRLALARRVGQHQALPGSLVLLGLQLCLALGRIRFRLAQARQLGAATRLVVDQQRAFNLLRDRLQVDLMGKALLRQLDLLAPMQLRQFQLAAHLDGCQRPHMFPVGRFICALRALLRQFLFQLAQRQRGATVERLAPRFRFQDAPIQVDLAPAQRLQALRFLVAQFGFFQRRVLLQFRAAVRMAGRLFFAPDALPLFLVIQLVELLHAFQAVLLQFLRRQAAQPQGADGCVGVALALVVPQADRFHPRHGQAAGRKALCQGRLQAFVQFGPQVGIRVHLAQRAAADEFQRNLTHGRQQQGVQVGARDSTRRAHELARKGIGLAQRDIHAQGRGNVEQLRAGQAGQVEFQADGSGARDQHFGRSRRQQRGQARKESGAVIVAGRYQGESVRLHDPGARLGRHLQAARRAAEQRGQFAHAKEQG